LLCVWRRVCLYESLMQLFFRERQNDKEEKEGEMRWFRLLCLDKQQSIDLLFIIDHYSLLCSVYLSLSLFPFFCQQRFICTRTLVRLYLSLRHVSRTQAYMYK
jgi:hypothetical protein